MSQNNNIPFHPSYGYATPQEIMKLQSLPKGSIDKINLLKKIEERNKSK